MADNKIISQSLALLSGKGGSGKTVIALSMSRVLAEAGLKVLLIDCDIATHGSTYFFESELEVANENILSLSQYIYGHKVGSKPLRTKAGFDFVPSTLNPAKDIEDIREPQEPHSSDILSALTDYIYNSDMVYDVIIFDCQAGYSPVTRWAAAKAKKSLIVLEPDVVSAAALRVLHLQIGDVLRRSSTWQIFNKLSEEERQIYEKMSIVALFPNFPPIPFDWQVRGAFATCEIPSVASRGSAFGLGVLRIMQTLFPKYIEQLEKLENETIGEWYNDITIRLVELEEKKREDRRKKKFNTLLNMVSPLMAMIVALGGMLYFLKSRTVYYSLDTSKEVIMIGALCALILSAFFAMMFRRESEDESIVDINREIERHKTLIAADPRLREYSRKMATEYNDDLISQTKEILMDTGITFRTVEDGHGWDFVGRIHHGKRILFVVKSWHGRVSRDALVSLSKQLNLYLERERADEAIIITRYPVKTTPITHEDKDIHILPIQDLREYLYRKIHMDL